VKTHTRRSVLAAAGLTAATTAVVPMLPPTSRAYGADPADPNLLYHTGFEDPTDESWLFSYVNGDGVTVPVTSYDATSAYVGTHCLKYSRPAGTVDSTTGKLPYVSATRAIPSEVGGEYEATIFVRTENLSSASEYYGVRLALQTYDANGRWVATYPSSGYMGSSWSMMTTRTPKLSAKEVKLEVIMYLYRDRTGDVWFDELTVRSVAPPALQVQLHYPAYRGLIIPGDGEAVRLEANIDPTALAWSEHSVRMRLTTTAGHEVSSQTMPAAATVSFSEPVDGLPATTMTLDVDVINNSNDAVAASSAWDIERLTEAPTSYLDHHGRFVRDGEFFFPMGLFASDLNDTAVRSSNPSDPTSPPLPTADLSRLSGTPFNTLMAYAPPDASDLDHAWAHGINVVYALNHFFYDAAGKYHWPEGVVIEDAADEITVITDTVNTYRSHPAMLGWYLSDELNIDFFGPRLIAHHEAVAANDPLHPTFNVNPYVMAPETYLRCGDTHGVDTYPIYGRPTDDIARPGILLEGARQALPHKGMWPVAQAIDWRYYTKADQEQSEDRQPTRAELRCMYWQFVVGGATGLFLYQFPLMDDALLADASFVCAEIAAQIPVIMGVESLRPVTSSAGDTIDWTVREHDGGGYVIAVSTNRSSQSTTFTAEWAMSATEVLTGQTIAIDSAGTLSDILAPIGVRMYRLTPPSFDSLAELTEAELQLSGKAAARGVSTATTKILGRAKAKAGSNEAEEHLNDYRDLVRSEEGSLLSSDTVANLLRLSKALS